MNLHEQRVDARCHRGARQRWDVLALAAGGVAEPAR
jgi:hypothetical protein